MAETLWPIDVPFVAGHEKRSEEWDALDVVPMGVADQDVAADLQRRQTSDFGLASVLQFRNQQ